MRDRDLVTIICKGMELVQAVKFHRWLAGRIFLDIINAGG
jgi:hypothetical protein